MKLFIFIASYFLPYITFAQSAYMHEVAEDADGRSPIPFIFTIIIIWYLYNAISNSKSAEIKKDADNSDKLQKKSLEKNEVNKSNSPNTTHVDSFTKQCIAIYGNSVEIVDDYLILKEDGNYCIITNDDIRYKPIINHIKTNSLNRRFLKLNFPQIQSVHYYIDDCLKSGKLTTAKPMEEHGVIEPDFYGGRIIALKMYYDKEFESGLSYLKHKPLIEYVIDLGFDFAIFLHKKIETPMDLGVYKKMRDMQILKMNYSEYILYMNIVGHICQRGKEFYDGEGNFIGNSWTEANAYYEKKQGITYDNALTEINNIEWHL